MPLAEREPHAQVYGEYVDEPSTTKVRGNPVLGGILAFLTLSFAVLGYKYADLYDRFGESLAMQALRSYRRQHRQTGYYPTYPDSFDVHGERDLEDFCRDREAIFVSDQSQSTVIIKMTYSGLFGRRSLEIGSPKPDGWAKDGSPIYLPHKTSMREL